MEGFLHYRFGGLIFGGAYTWRGLFSEFYGISIINSERNRVNVITFDSFRARTETFARSFSKLC